MKVLIAMRNISLIRKASHRNLQQKRCSFNPFYNEAIAMHLKQQQWLILHET